MADQYRIVESQLSLLGGLGGHNLIAILNPDGSVYKELDGIATTPGGTELPIGFIPFYHRLSFKVYSEQHFYNPSQIQSTLFTGSETDVLIRFDAALGAGAEINQRNFFYPPLGFGDNSNSVASTLIQAMGLTEPQLSGVPFYRFTPGAGTVLLDNAQIINIQQIFGILPSVPGSSRVVDLQKAVNNPDGTITIFTTYEDGTSAISTYSQNGFGESLYGVDGSLIGSVNASSSNAGKVSVSISGQVGQVNWNNANITVLPGGQTTITGRGDTILALANSTVQTTTYNATIITAAGAGLSVLGSNNNLILGTGTTVDMLGNDNTVIGRVPPGSVSDQGTGNQSLGLETLLAGVEVDVFSSTGFNATLDDNGIITVGSAGDGGNSIDGFFADTYNSEVNGGSDPGDSGGGDPGGDPGTDPGIDPGTDPGTDPVINGHSFILTGDLHVIAGNGNEYIDMSESTGNNTVIAGDGNDYLLGGGGHDVLSGGAGDDELQLEKMAA